MDLNRSGLDLRGCVALITGGSRGIGRATAELLAKHGVNIVVNYVKDEAAASAVVASVEELGVKGIAVKADVSKIAQAEALLEKTLERFSRLDLLICNSGIWEGAPLEEMSEELWDRVIDVNLKGTWTICRSAVPVMKEQNFGKIVIVSSTAGQRGEANVSNYAASKGGQISFMKSLAVEVAPYGINVNCVAPGWVDTEMTAHVFADEAFRKEVTKSIPVRRIATAEDIARPIVFLCSDWARHITGEVLSVNGGSVL
jgi:3-oxoacyl-[acyl-carrier protein] reductase